MTKKKNKNKKPITDFFREGISDATGRNEKDISDEEIIESIKLIKEIDKDGNEINPLNETKKIKYIEITLYHDGKYDYNEIFTQKDLKNVYWKGSFFVIESTRGTFIFSSLSSGLIEIYYEDQEIQSYEDKKRKNHE